ncbi:VCBS repeat-containing protein [Parafilimonas sp.]|uniref:VCBS repeat-containing protein n=1 Tax=Parafilimonas sp. TaxID=1969739 RepID=UPI0039E557E2
MRFYNNFILKGCFRKAAFFIFTNTVVLLPHPRMFQIKIKLIIAFLIIYLVSLRLQLSAQQKLFTLLDSTQTGIGFANNITESETLNVLAFEYFFNGGGVAVGDINNDGLPDLFFTANMQPNKLYLNLGHMKFKDITEQANPLLAGRKGGWKTGATIADVNGDGLPDIYVCYSGIVNDDARRNQLFINKGFSPSPAGEGRGEVKFEEEAKQYGLDDKSFSTQAAFFDYDNDGDLDMFLLNHSNKKIGNDELAKYRNDVDSLAGNKLYDNDGHGHFKDVSAKAGLHQNALTFGLGIAIADINNDGWQDVYVTNDYNEPDYLYINNHNGTFTDDTKNRLQHLAQFSMGVDVADYNNDGLPDIINLDMLPEDNKRQKQLQLQENYESLQLMVSQGIQKQYMRNALQLNNGDGTFSEIAQFAGVSNTDWSWAPLLADFDNDGYKDLFVTNGYLRDYTNKDFLHYWGDYKVKKAMERQPVLLMDLVKAMPATRLPNYIFRNNHDISFTNEMNNWGLDETSISSGAVYADLDNDGDLDLVVNNINTPAFVYQNMASENNKAGFISIQLKGDKQNSSAIGAKVYVYANGSEQYQEVNPSRGYLSCLPAVLTFGLGTAPAIDSIRIIFPGGETVLLQQQPVNQHLVIDEKEAAEKYIQPSGKPFKTIFTKDSSIIKYARTEFDENDFKRQPLMLFMYSKTGPVMAKADVNKDSLDDVFISGDGNNPGKIYVQQHDGSFRPIAGLSIGDENTSAISAAAFFDANGDGFPDLYIAKGGYSLFEPNTPALQDELYINDGKGNFSKLQNALPDVSAGSKSCVRPCDYDNDGDLDLFVGGRVIPGQYPAAPESFLLQNNGKGYFTKIKVSFAKAGMVTDAQWIDLNNDGRKDLIICGEMMPVEAYINSANDFTDATATYFPGSNNGFWNTLAVADINGDGKDDIIAGNLGLNSQIRASADEPAKMYYADFDGDGNPDPIFNFYIQGKSYPFVSRDELNNQITAMRKKFTTYRDYASATITDIFSPDEISKADSLMVNELHTCTFINTDGKFIKTALPSQAQFTYISKIIADDFDKDGKTDLLLLGNHSDNRLKLGAVDASYGTLLKGDGKGSFTYIPQTRSGMCIKGDVKSALMMHVQQSRYLFAGAAGSSLQVYKVNE